MKNALSPIVLIRYHGDTMSPGAGTPCPQVDLKEKFIQKPIAVIADGRLEKSDRVLWDAIRYFEFVDSSGICRQPLRVVAALANISERQAKRSAARLIECGYVKRDRGLAFASDCLRTVSAIAEKSAEVVAQAEARISPAVVKCAICARKCKRLPKDSICRTCKREKRMREILADYPDLTDAEVRSELQVRESPGFRRLLKKVRGAA